MKKTGSKKINKKVLIISLVCVALVCAIVAIIVSQATKLTNESYADCAIGDVNGDGFINAADALLITSHINGTLELFETQQKNADVNLDGVLDSKDIEFIHKYATGTIKKLPFTGEANDSLWGDGNIIETDNDGVKTTIQLVNTWANPDGTYSYQVNVKVTNERNSRLRNWETIITFSEDVAISKSWDCESVAEGTTLTAEGDTISSEATAKFGFVLTAQQGLTVEDIVTEY